MNLIIWEIYVIDFLEIVLLEILHWDEVVFLFKNVEIEKPEIYTVHVFCDVGEEIAENFHFGEPKLNMIGFVVNVFLSVKQKFSVGEDHNEIVDIRVVSEL